MTSIVRQSLTPIELLAPAGDQNCLQAAIENGADAVYFGLDRGFNARARATNFCLENLAEVMQRLHERQVKGYVTLNTLVFSDELPEFERVVAGVARAGVDAVLLQDLGAVSLVRAVCPDLPIHASTQMTLTCAESIRVAEHWGIERVVLPRELSLDEIRQIRAQTQMPLEVFVHGALCVAYSGQCLTSESLGGRSANRGQCAQACRLPYELYCDGQHTPLPDARYLLSPQDLAAYELVPALIEAGVCSLKIEGRLKSPEYVASITRHYRSALQAAMVGDATPLADEVREEMELTFSRGLAPGWLEGCDHKRLVPAHSSAKRGVRIGTVRQVRGRRIEVVLQRSLRVGDGVMFDCGQDQNQQPGGRIRNVWQDGQPTKDPVSGRGIEITLHGDDRAWSAIKPGVVIWKSDDPELRRALRQTYEQADPQQKLPLDMELQAEVGQPLRLRVHLASASPLELSGSEPLQAARRHPLTPEAAAEQLGRLGHTPYRLQQLRCTIQGAPMVPHSVFGQLRKEMIERLGAQLREVPPRQIAVTSVLPQLRPTRSPASVESRPTAQLNQPSVPDSGDEPRAELHLLCRTLMQLEAAMDLGVRHVSVDFGDPREYREAAARAREADVTLWLATPRILKPGELGVFRAIEKHVTTGVLARNLAALDYFVARDIRVIADYSLNVANELTVARIRELGAERITASYDLNRDQLSRLVAASPASWLEVVIHQHMPMFHMEHCVFCAVLSPGTNKTNCGRPCDRHVVHLEDRVGQRHLLTADVGCRNTLYNSQAQSGAELVGSLQQQGVRWFRVELLEENTQAKIRRIVQLYQQLLAAQVTGDHVWRQLQATNRVGVTRGTLEAARDPLAIL